MLEKGKIRELEDTVRENIKNETKKKKKKKTEKKGRKIKMNQSNSVMWDSLQSLHRQEAQEKT